MCSSDGADNRPIRNAAAHSACACAHSVVQMVLSIPQNTMLRTPSAASAGGAMKRYSRKGVLGPSRGFSAGWSCSRGKRVRISASARFTNALACLVESPWWDRPSSCSSSEGRKQMGGRVFQPVQQIRVSAGSVMPEDRCTVWWDSLVMSAMWILTIPERINVKKSVG